jgi:hypothetical protein
MFRGHPWLPLANQDRSLAKERGESDEIETIRTWLILVADTDL